MTKNNHSLKEYTLQQISERLEPNQREIFIKTFQEKTKNNQIITVYADGCFDMFHLGHARLFKQIKKMYKNIHLIIGVCSDADIEQHKGSTVMNQDERCESVEHCGWVDEVLFPAPWSPTLEFINSKKIDFIAHDTIPYNTPDFDDTYAEFKNQGRFLPTLRTEGISTSDLLIRILKDRQGYFEKVLKKGTHREELNLGNMEYLYIQTKGVLNVLKHCLKDDKKVEHQIIILKYIIQINYFHSTNFFSSSFTKLPLLYYSSSIALKRLLKFPAPNPQ